jgi:hypothetical protein
MPSVIRAGRQVMSAKRTTQHHGTRASNWPDPGFRCLNVKLDRRGRYQNARLGSSITFSSGAGVVWAGTSGSRCQRVLRSGQYSHQRLPSWRSWAMGRRVQWGVRPRSATAPGPRGWSRSSHARCTRHAPGVRRGRGCAGRTSGRSGAGGCLGRACPRSWQSPPAGTLLPAGWCRVPHGVCRMVRVVTCQAAGTPAAGTPAAGTPAAGTPAAGTPAAGTPAAGTPAVCVVVFACPWPGPVLSSV